MISPLMTGASAPKSYGRSGSLTGAAPVAKRRTAVMVLTAFMAAGRGCESGSRTAYVS